MPSPELIILRLALATVLGGLVGLEREWRSRAAGLRTHAMVSVGAALVMLVSAYGFSDVLPRTDVTLDPSRVAAQVVSGIGFLGAGVIFFQRNAIRGLTTAASVWAVAAIGLAVGGGLYFAAATTTALTLIILAVLKPVERRLFARRPHRLTLLLDRKATSLFAIETALETAGVAIERLLIRPALSADADRLDLVLQRPTSDTLRAALELLRRVPGVLEIRSGATARTAERRGAAE